MLTLLALFLTFIVLPIGTATIENKHGMSAAFVFMIITAITVYILVT